MELTLSSTATLNNGVTIPYLGLGVFQSQTGTETREAVHWALEAGYRHIDTAKIYRNESDVGLAIRESGIPREEIFITTKLFNDDHGYDKALQACQGSLSQLGLDYLDLYLIHWPVEGLRSETWRALETLLAQGKCRAIGVSNYTVRHLQELLAVSQVVPAVNQVEFHPYLYQSELLEFCRSHQIQLEAYSPLTRGRRLTAPELSAMAQTYQKTTAQILIRWALQHQLVVLPKSVQQERIASNAAVFDFEISPADMHQLNLLNEDLRTCWDPTHAP